MSGKTIDYASLKDEELVELSSKGDKAALEALTLRFFKPTGKITTAGYLDSDDLMQEGMFGFLYAVENYTQSRGVPFAAYAHLCMNSRIKNAVRKIKNSVEQSLDEELSQGDSGVDVAVELENNELLKNVLGMCETHLSSLEKTVLFCHITGLGYKATAKKLGITDKAVENALSRARKKIKEIIK